jgi:hypothetical protein
MEEKRPFPPTSSVAARAIEKLLSAKANAARTQPHLTFEEHFDILMQLLALGLLCPTNGFLIPFY